MVVVEVWGEKGFSIRVIISDASRARELTKMNERSLSNHCGHYEYYMKQELSKWDICYSALAHCSV